MEHFSDIKDPRVERTKKHQLIDILVIAILAVIAGAQGWEDIENYGISEQTYKRSLRQKMKRTAMDNNYMIQVLSCCFINNTLDSSDSLCQAGLRCSYPDICMGKPLA